MKRVYVAGSFSADNVLQVFENMRKGMKLSTEVFMKGHAPFCPWADYHFSLMKEASDVTSVEMFYAYSIAFLEVCDCMLLVPGWEKSRGTKKEIDIANLHGIPIFYDIDSMLKWAGTK